MNKKYFFIIVAVVGAVLWFWFSSNKSQNLISPTLTPSPSSIPPQSPKTFKYDSSTDLKMELEKVNPQILDSDFE